MVERSFTNYVVVEAIPVAVTYTSDIAPVSRKELLDIQATKESTFTLKRACYMIRTHSYTVAGLLCFRKVFHLP